MAELSQEKSKVQHFQWEWHQQKESYEQQLQILSEKLHNEQKQTNIETEIVKTNV